MTSHETYMAACLALAVRGAGQVAPNPMVGSVIVHRDRIIGRGFHERFGGPHAEVNAVRSVTDTTLLKESTLYVSLEPCCHFGKTPPCTDLILETKIPRVVVGVTDPFAAVSGGGVKKLRAAGVDVVENVLAAECAEVNRRFFTFHREKRPYVILKWAETADRFIARSDGTSKWISGEAARTLVHTWRAEEAAIMVGTRTARVDDPELTVRHVAGRNPLRIVVDTDLALPPTLRLFDRSTPTLVFNAIRSEASPNLEYIVCAKNSGLAGLVSALDQRGILSLIVEGGRDTLARFIDADLWDEARVFRNPKLLFSEGIPAPQLLHPTPQVKTIGDDELFLIRNLRAQGATTMSNP